MAKVLIVIDAQNDFINGSLGSEEARRVAYDVVDRINNHNGLIVCTLDTHYDNYLNTQEGIKLPVAHCIRDTDGWQFEEKIYDALSERSKQNYKRVLVVEKQTFGSVDLSSVIPDDTTQIEIIGYVLDICVVSNALLLKAFYPEIPIAVNVACCAATSQENRNATIKVLKSCQVEVISE